MKKLFAIMAALFVMASCTTPKAEPAVVVEDSVEVVEDSVMVVESAVDSLTVVVDSLVVE